MLWAATLLALFIPAMAREMGDAGPIEHYGHIIML